MGWRGFPAEVGGPRFLRNDSFMNLFHLAIALAAFALWYWMWANAEKVKAKVPWLLAWLFHLWLCATWVGNLFAAFRAR